MAHVTNRRRVKKVQKERKVLLSALISGDWVEEAQCKFGPLPPDEAERVATAATAFPGLDLWAWAQGGVQFLNPAQIKIAARYGLQDWIEGAVEGSDSADTFFTIRGEDGRPCEMLVTPMHWQFIAGVRGTLVAIVRGLTGPSTWIRLLRKRPETPIG